MEIQPNESGFIGRRPTNIERPNIVQFIGRSILNANQIWNYTRSKQNGAFEFVVRAGFHAIFTNRKGKGMFKKRSNLQILLVFKS